MFKNIWICTLYNAYGRVISKCHHCHDEQNKNLFFFPWKSWDACISINHYSTSIEYMRHHISWNIISWRYNCIPAILLSPGVHKTLISLTLLYKYSRKVKLRSKLSSIKLMAAGPGLCLYVRHCNITSYIIKVY